MHDRVRHHTTGQLADELTDCARERRRPEGRRRAEGYFKWFLAVDAQTREQLQFELLRIWDARPTAMLFVTHAIEEAVLMGDRVVVLAGRPASVHEVFSIDLPRPRDRAITGRDDFVRARNSVWRALVQGSGGLA